MQIGGENNMSTIKCPHCGRKISPEASVCPYCGCPGSTIARTAKSRAKWKAIGLVALLIIFMIGYFSDNKKSKHKDSFSSPAVEQQSHSKASTQNSTEIQTNRHQDNHLEESASEVKQEEQEEEVSIPLDKLDEFLSKPNETPSEVN